MLSDRLGRRRVLVAGLLLTLVSDALVAVSPGEVVYLAGRTLAGIGLGMTFVAAFMLVMNVASDRIGPALGVYQGVGMVTVLVVGFIGGSLATPNWRLAFLIVPLVALVSALLVLRTVPDVKPIPGGRIDFAGLILVALGTAGFLFGVSHASTALGSPLTWAPMLTGVVLLAAFAWHESRSQDAVFPMKLFRSPVFVVAVLTGIMWNLVSAVLVLQNSNLWQYVLGYTTIEVSFMLLPITACSAVAAFLIGRMLGKGVTPRSLIMASCSMITIGCLLTLLVDKHSKFWIFIPILLLVGVGTTFTAVPQAKLYMDQAPPEDFGPVTSSRMTVGQFGFALGLAGSMSLVSALTLGGVTRKLKDSGVPPSQIGEGIDAVVAYANRGTKPSTEAARQALQAASDSYVSAYVTTMLVTAAIVVAVGIVSWFGLAHEGQPPAEA